MSAPLGERLQALGAQALAGFQALAPDNRGRLVVGAVVALAALLVLTVPPRRGEGGIWPRLWACGTLGGLGALILFLPR